MTKTVPPNIEEFQEVEFVLHIMTQEVRQQ